MSIFAFSDLRLLCMPAILVAVICNSFALDYANFNTGSKYYLDADLCASVTVWNVQYAE